MGINMNKDEVALHNVLRKINNSWLTGRPEEMKIYLHPQIVMKFPGFSGEITGREKLIESFKEFCTNAQILEYSESDEQINVIGNCAIVVFRFEMIYEKRKYRDKSTGRDFWIFEKEDDNWLAVWRTMMDVNETKLIEK